MEEKFIQVAQFSEQDLISLIEERVSNAIKALSHLQPANSLEPEFYSRADVAEILGVSLTTLYLWNKQGILNHNKIGNRVYYARSEVLSKLKIAS